MNRIGFGDWCRILSLCGVVAVALFGPFVWKNKPSENGPQTISAHWLSGGDPSGKELVVVVDDRTKEVLVPSYSDELTTLTWRYNKVVLQNWAAERELNRLRAIEVFRSLSCALLGVLLMEVIRCIVLHKKMDQGKE